MEPLALSLDRSHYSLPSLSLSLFDISSVLQAIFSTAISHANSASLQQWSAIVATGNSAQPFILVGSQAVVLGSTYSYSVYYLYSNGTTSKYVSHRQEATGSVESLCQSPQTPCH